MILQYVLSVYLPTLFEHMLCIFDHVPPNHEEQMFGGVGQLIKFYLNSFLIARDRGTLHTTMAAHAAFVLINHMGCDLLDEICRF